MSNLENASFLGVREIAALGTTDLREELLRLIDGLKGAICEGHGPSSQTYIRWQEEIGWVLRESQCRFASGWKQSLYDCEFKNIYQNAIYGPRPSK